MADVSAPSAKRQRTGRADEEEEGALAAVEAAYENIDGYAIARGEVRAQRARGVFIDGVQYGEIDAATFASALSRLSVREGETFVDVGSGTGKAVLTAAALYPLARATGVEIQEPLHDAAVAARDASRSALLTSDVRFRRGDAFAYDWPGYDVVFVNAAVFTPEMVDLVNSGAERLKPGARLLISTRPLSAPVLRLLWQDKLKTGKGSLLFRAYERIESTATPEDAPPAGT